MGDPVGVAIPGLGLRIRALRQERGLRLKDVSGSLGRSVGWLSQVERDMSVLTMTDLKLILQALGADMSVLMTDRPQDGHRILRRDERPFLDLTESGARLWRVAPGRELPFEMVELELPSGAEFHIEGDPGTVEAAVVTRGQLDLWIGLNLMRLGVGDSFRLEGEAVRLMNSDGSPCLVLRVQTPRPARASEGAEAP